MCLHFKRFIGVYWSKMIMSLIKVHKKPIDLQFCEKNFFFNRFFFVDLNTKLFQFFLIIRKKEKNLFSIFHFSAYVWILKYSWNEISCYSVQKKNYIFPIQIMKFYIFQFRLMTNNVFAIFMKTSKKLS